jgi:hypothetical protein
MVNPTDIAIDARYKFDLSMTKLKNKVNKGIDPMRRRGRAYGLGERNPDTLPGLYGGLNRSETVEENREGTAYWSSLGKKVRAGSRLGRHLP